MTLPRRLLSLLLPVCALVAAVPAEAAHARQHAAKKHAVAHPPAARKKAVAQAKRAVPAVQKAVAPVDPDAPLRLTANVAYVVDPQTGEVLLGKNQGLVHPIASLTKMMTAMVIAEAKLPMDEKITITDDDVDRLKFSSSRLPVGSVLTRAETLHLALMASENRAAHALARTYPGGESAFVSAMNVKARQLGMEDTRYVEPTGLNSQNQSTAHDLALLAAAASNQPMLREYSTTPNWRVATGKGTVRFINTNRLVRSGTWDILLQKTGYIREAGECLLMKAEVAGRKLIMVLLDSDSSLARARDAERVRAWLRAHPEASAKN